MIMQKAGHLKEDVAAPLKAPAAQPAGLSESLVQLPSLSTAQLRSLWQRQYQVQVPKGLSRDLLLRFIAHRMQEEALGGLSKATFRRLRALRGEFEDAAGGRGPRVSTSLKPGTRLLREWNGDTHTVLVLQDGFEYRGKRFASLTKVAAAISGLHRSGPVFFGLKGSRQRFAEQGRGFAKAEAGDE